MKNPLEVARAYLELQMREEARKELLAAPRTHPDFVECWNELTWLSDRTDLHEQRRLSEEGSAMIASGCRDSLLIENTALCRYFAGDFHAAYELQVMLQNSIKWTATSRYALATFASLLGRWSDAAWLVLLCIRTGGDSHLFFDLDLLPLWKFGGSEELDTSTALALAHPKVQAEFNQQAGRSAVIDPSMEKVLPERFRPHMRYRIEGDFLQLSPIATDAVRADFDVWKKTVALRIEAAARSAIHNARNHILNKQLAWATNAAKRGDTFAARWHTQFALASRPDWLPRFSAKLSGLGLREVMQDLSVALSRREDFCRLVLEARPITFSSQIADYGLAATSQQIAEIGRGTGYELFVRASEAKAEKDIRTQVACNLALLRRWPEDPAAASNVLRIFCSAKKWSSAEWLLRRSKRSLLHFTHAKKLIAQITSRSNKQAAGPDMSDSFYGQPDIAGLVRYGDPKWAALGTVRRRHEVPSKQLRTCAT